VEVVIEGLDKFAVAVGRRLAQGLVDISELNQALRPQPAGGPADQFAGQQGLRGEQVAHVTG